MPAIGARIIEGERGLRIYELASFRLVGFAHRYILEVVWFVARGRTEQGGEGGAIDSTQVVVRKAFRIARDPFRIRVFIAVGWVVG